MKVIKWLDEHFEEVLLVSLLAIISCVELMQVVARNVPFFPALTWAEELCRFAWIATVFMSIPYTIRTCTALRVTALIDIIPWKLRNIFDVAVDAVTAVLMAFLTVNAVTVFQRVLESGETSPAMVWPMWIMYLFVLVGFALGALRAVQMCVIHIKNINVEPANTVEEQAKQELEAEKRNAEKQEQVHEADVIASAFTNGRSDA
ncbi:MAG: TRAP transporter small permease [Eggerthellales bacterium]|nr:TRAP transporter small permease [Eggerthellales bacterium]